MNKTEDLISVIVPVYNVENYLVRCLDSILDQTYRNLEIILIDDGSSDTSGEICDQYARKDSRITVLHKKNCGVSAARNTALSMKHGRYLSFIDADDWIDKKMIETQYENIIRENAQISIIGYQMVWENGNTQTMSDQAAYYVWNRDEALSEWIMQRTFKGFMCDKLFAAELFENVRFPEELSYMEDVSVGLALFDRADRVVYSGKTGYYYLQRSGSATNSSFSPRELTGLKIDRKIIEYSKENGHKYDNEAYSRYLMTAFTLLDRIIALKSRENYQLVPELKKKLKKYQAYSGGGGVNRYNKLFIKMICYGFPSNIVIGVRHIMLKIKRKLS